MGHYSRLQTRRQMLKAAIGGAAGVAFGSPLAGFATDAVNSQIFLRFLRNA